MMAEIALSWSWSGSWSYAGNTKHKAGIHPGWDANPSPAPSIDPFFKFHLSNYFHTLETINIYIYTCMSLYHIPLSLILAVLDHAVNGPNIFVNPLKHLD